MIIGSLNQLKTLSPVTPWIQSIKALEALTLDSNEGISNISGNDHFINVHSYSTRKREDCRFENHQRTIDLQFIIEGRETIDITPIGNLEADGDYDEANDFQFHSMLAPNKYSSIELTPGLVAIFFPEDPHRPQIAYKKKSVFLRKAVVKLPIALIES
ncbi:MAG: YhcH/YjgK/YiaL family protein [Opitutales bacterium]|nr:YhcH/YjgK/YiaL family protein [Opitutales bacterium]